MSSQNETVVQRWSEELWNPRRSFRCGSDHCAEFYRPRSRFPVGASGIEGCKTLVTGYRTVFPDIHFTVEKQVAPGDTVVSHWRCTGTHRGELMGVAPTGKRMEVEGISILESQNHQTTIWDALGLMQQIGAIPALRQATA